MEPKKLTDEERAMYEELAQTHDAIHPGQLLAHIAAMETEHRALVADNAALARSGHWLEHERDAYHPMNCRCGVCERARDVFKQPHPGAALLSEMEALRKRVAELEEDKAHWDEREATLKSEADHLRGVIIGRTEERDEARAQVATARAAALEEAATQIEDMWIGCHRMAEACGRDGAKAIRAMRGTTPPPPVVPVAKDALRDAVGGIIHAIRRGLSRNDWGGMLMATYSEWKSIADAYGEP